MFETLYSDGFKDKVFWFEDPFIRVRSELKTLLPVVDEIAFHTNLTTNSAIDIQDAAQIFTDPREFPFDAAIAYVSDSVGCECTTLRCLYQCSREALDLIWELPALREAAMEDLEAYVHACAGVHISQDTLEVLLANECALRALLISKWWGLIKAVFLDQVLEWRRGRYWVKKLRATEIRLNPEPFLENVDFARESLYLTGQLRTKPRVREDYTTATGGVFDPVSKTFQPRLPVGEVEFYYEEGTLTEEVGEFYFMPNGVVYNNQLYRFYNKANQGIDFPDGILRTERAHVMWNEPVKAASWNGLIIGVAENALVVVTKYGEIVFVSPPPFISGYPKPQADGVWIGSAYLRLDI